MCTYTVRRRRRRPPQTTRTCLWVTQWPRPRIIFRNPNSVSAVVTTTTTRHPIRPIRQAMDSLLHYPTIWWGVVVVVVSAAGIIIPMDLHIHLWCPCIRDIIWDIPWDTWTCSSSSRNKCIIISNFFFSPIRTLAWTRRRSEIITGGVIIKQNVSLFHIFYLSCKSCVFLKWWWWWLYYAYVKAHIDMDNTRVKIQWNGVNHFAKVLAMWWIAVVITWNFVKLTIRHFLFGAFLFDLGDCD